MGEVTMPRLSDSMEEGTILKWLKQSGEEVKRGEPLVEIETDKAAMTYEADSDGALEITAEEGTTLPLGALIAYIGERTAADRSRVLSSGSVGIRASAEPTLTGATHSTERLDSSPTVQKSSDDRIKASPLARRIALDRGVELKDVSGSGPGGRIIKADVEQAPETAEQSAETAATEPGAERTVTAAVETAKGEVEVRELSRTQQTIARRMAESRATVPDFSLRMEIEMERALELREQLADPAAGIPAPSLNDLIVKACALALREFPLVNGSYRDGRFELHSRVNIGIAVATQDALVVPTVLDADRRSLHELSAESKRLIERTRSGEITPPELSGGTFTVSNLGMFGIDDFTAVINPPQAAILTVGAVKPRAVADGSELVIRNTTRLELSCDHRIVYGAEAARFLVRVRELLEHPAALT